MRRDELLTALCDRIESLRLTHPTRVGIDGVDAAGKTTLADELAVQLRERDREVIRASVDDFHHPRRVRMAQGPDSPEGYYHDSFDYPALTAALLEPLGPGGSRRARTAAFDHASDRPVRAPEQSVGASAILVFDGIFLHRPELLDHWDLSIFLEVGFDVTVPRAVRRDVGGSGSARATRERYARRYVPGQRLYLAKCQPERLAGAVVDHRDFESPGLRWRAPGPATGTETIR